MIGSLRRSALLGALVVVALLGVGAVVLIPGGDAPTAAGSDRGTPGGGHVQDEAAGRRPPAEHLPQLTDDGELQRPEGWEAWVLAGTSMGLTYNEPAGPSEPGEPPGSFLNVYLQPWAYEAFMTNGAFPDGTMFVLAGSEPVRKADPARGGFYQGELSLMEVHLKEEGIDPTGWAFYGFGGGAESAAKIPGDASCYSCHAEKADFDDVFVQFYPKMRERLGVEVPADGGG